MRTLCSCQYKNVFAITFFGLLKSNVISNFSCRLLSLEHKTTFSLTSHGIMDRYWWNQSGVLWTEILQGLVGNRDFQNLGHRSSGAIRCTCGVLPQLTAISQRGGYMLGMQFLCSDGWVSPGSPHHSDLSWVHLKCFFWPVKHTFCFPHFTFGFVSSPFACPTFW